MAANRDAVLLESTTTHRARLRAALLFGVQDERRTASDNVRRLIGSIVLAAVACAICIGVSFVMNILETQAAEKAAQESSLTPSPTPTSSETATSDPAVTNPASPAPESTAPASTEPAPIPTETP